MTSMGESDNHVVKFAFIIFSLQKFISLEKNALRYCTVNQGVCPSLFEMLSINFEF